jgi:hypothetical protein
MALSLGLSILFKEHNPLRFQIAPNNERNFSIFVCDSSDDSYVNGNSIGDGAYIYDVVMSLVSCISLALISMVIFRDERLMKTHPNNLIAVNCLCDSFIYF